MLSLSGVLAMVTVEAPTETTMMDMVRISTFLQNLKIPVMCACCPHKRMSKYFHI